MEYVETRSPTGKVTIRKVETAEAKPAETTSREKPKAKHVGGGWYETPEGKRVRKSKLEAGD